MLSATALTASGAQWWSQLASTTKMPSGGVGASVGAGATPTNAELLTADTYNRDVVIESIQVTTAGGTTANIVWVFDGGGGGGGAANIATVLFTVNVAALGLIQFGPEGLRIPKRADGTNIGSIGLTLGVLTAAIVNYKVVN